MRIDLQQSPCFSIVMAVHYPTSGFLHDRDGNLILTALAIGRVPLINATKSLGFVLAQVVLTLACASGRVLISNPVIHEDNLWDS